MIRLHPLPYLQNADVWERPLEFIPERWTRSGDVVDDSVEVRIELVAKLWTAK